jgi:hypothetical protein
MTKIERRPDDNQDLLDVSTHQGGPESSSGRRVGIWGEDLMKKKNVVLMTIRTSLV